MPRPSPTGARRARSRCRRPPSARSRRRLWRPSGATPKNGSTAAVGESSRRIPRIRATSSSGAESEGGRGRGARSGGASTGRERGAADDRDEAPPRARSAISASATSDRGGAAERRVSAPSAVAGGVGLADDAALRRRRLRSGPGGRWLTDGVGSGGRRGSRARTRRSRPARAATGRARAGGQDRSAATIASASLAFRRVGRSIVGQKIVKASTGIAATASAC